MVTIVMAKSHGYSLKTQDAQTTIYEINPEIEQLNIKENDFLSFESGTVAS